MGDVIQFPNPRVHIDSDDEWDERIRKAIEIFDAEPIGSTALSPYLQAIVDKIGDKKEPLGALPPEIDAWR